MNKRQADEEARRQEAARVLERVQQESEVLGQSSFARVSNRVMDHMTAADGEQSDRVEVWAKRFARTLSVAAFIFLAVWLLRYLTR